MFSLVRPRQWSLRTQARVPMCLFVLLASLTLGELIARKSVEQARVDAGSQLLQTARHMADQLSNEMAARARDVLLLSQLDVLRDVTDPGLARAALEKLQSRMTTLAWIGMTDTQGTVIASTGDILKGVSIAPRPVFQNSQSKLWTGDVHTAVMLAKLVPDPTGEPIKFVDVAGPVMGADGKFRGVLALHLSWKWADQLRDSVIRPRHAADKLELMIVAADGSMLLAPKGAAASLNLPAARLPFLEQSYAVERWSDGREVLTSVAESRPTGDFAGFGWRVVVRDLNAADAMNIHLARRDAMAWTLGIGLLFALAGWWFIGLLVAPVERLADTLLTSDPRRLRIGIRPRRNNVRQIAQAVAHLQDTLKNQDESVQALVEQAHRDALTGLWNRAFLNEFSEQLPQHERLKNMELGVLCLDLDGFKPINDRCGHDAGDQVLVQVGKRLRQIAREEDMVFRLGGDEFLILMNCPRGEGPALCRTMATRILADIQRPMTYRTLSNLRVGCSIGGAVWTPEGAPLSDVICHADEALCAAKHGGRGVFRHFANANSTVAATLN